MVDAILKEAELRKEYINGKVETVYFGGGTPSLLTTPQLTGMIQQFKILFDIADDAEITLEANPDDINSEKLEGWKQVGINRLSIGIQSFADADLRWMNRAHDATQAHNSILLAQQHGFHNISIDLIYGTPTLDDQQWQENLETAISLGIPHLSCYALTVEPKTALEKMIAQNKMENTDPEKQARHFELLMEWLETAGYEHYEISNFAKPGMRSRHNSSYWKGMHYLGLGPSAHSFNSSSRQWNVANNSLYISSLEKNIIPFEIEALTSAQQLNEYIMTSLRTSEGLSLNHIKNGWGEEKLNLILDSIDPYVQSGHADITDDMLRLTKKGKLMADGIASALF